MAASTGEVGELSCRRWREARAWGCETTAVDSEGTAEEKEGAWDEDGRTLAEGSGALVDLLRRGVSSAVMESFRMRFSGLGAGGRRHTIHAVHHARWTASCRKGWRRVARQGHHRSRVPSKQGGFAADGVKAARQTIKRGNGMTYHWRLASSG